MGHSQHHDKSLDSLGIQRHIRNENISPYCRSSHCDGDNACCGKRYPMPCDLPAFCISMGQNNQRWQMWKPDSRNTAGSFHQLVDGFDNCHYAYASSMETEDA